MNSEASINHLPELSEEEENKFFMDVNYLIDQKIRPALMMDGGDMAVQGFNKLTNNKYEILVKLVGACGSCPSSAMTMKFGVERMLTENFERIELITQV